MNNWPRVERKYRVARKRSLKTKGIRPAKKSWLVCVETTAIPIPQWAIEKRFEGLSVGENRVWFRGRAGVHSRMLAFEDRKAGGNPEITKIEWRLCPVCGRILLAVEAVERRLMDESSIQGRQQPCNGECK